MGTLASLILNQAILGPLTPPCSVTNHTGSMVLALQDVPGPQQPFWLFTRGPIFKYCPVVLTRKQSLYSCHRLPWEVLKTSGIQSYHMEEPGLLWPGGDTVGKVGTSFFISLPMPSLTSSLPLISTYSCKNPLSFSTVTESKQIPKPSLLPDSSDRKTYSHSPPASVEHRCPVVGFPIWSSSPLFILCLMTHGAWNCKAECRTHACSVQCLTYRECSISPNKRGGFPLFLRSFVPSFLPPFLLPSPFSSFPFLFFFSPSLPPLFLSLCPIII